MGRCRRRLTSVTRVLRRLHRRVWRRPLGQGQSDGSMKLIAYINRATLDSDRRWTPLDLGDRQHCLGSQNASEVTFGEPNSAYSLTTRPWAKHRQSGEPQRTCPAVARVPHRFRLHAALGFVVRCLFGQGALTSTRKPPDRSTYEEPPADNTVRVDSFA